MDKTFFEQAISDTLDELNDDVTTDNATDSEPEVAEETEVIEEPEDTDTEIESEESEESEIIDDNEEYNSEEESDDEDLEEEEEEVASQPMLNQKDANAFAKLRTENKKYKDTIDFFDQRAKSMGLNGIEDLMEKTKEAELKREAEKQGIPLEYAKRLQELEEKVAKQDSENAERIARENSERVANSLNGFVEANNLDEKSVNKLANDLITDGITLDVLSNMSENSINRILKSYLPNEVSKQKELEKKEKIKKELPLSSKANTSNNTQDDGIDKIAQMLTSLN